MQILANILLRNKFLCFLYLIAPLLFGGIIYNIFKDATPRQLPIGILDYDKSTLSEEIIYNITHSPTLKPTNFYHSIKEAQEDLSTTKIYALVVIPQDMQKKIKMGVMQEITFYYNSQFILIGKTLDNAMLQIIALSNIKLQTGKNLIQVKNLQAAMGKSAPILPHINALFNPKNSYIQFLGTLILPCIWQILLALGLLNLLSYPIKNSGDFFMRFGFNLLIFMFWGMVMIYFFSTLKFPLVGNISLIFFALLILGISISAIVAFLQSIFLNATKSISLIAAYTAPSLAFAGVTYPQSAMDSFALFWSHILPISYFMELYFQQAHYGGDILEGFFILAKMLPFLLFLPAAWLIYKIKGKI
ncbi:ABC transporter permease [Helicobacter anatolicus]|uniref:ABC transporter permease n=1 Tax=Helicobacter anatolicus TaxID=2905874 RepID=UPI001E34DBDD|nr:ABC transporter permease [Helicobacter anatolicus]MCE3039948.1 ABC transporter permease [Helicobacter anatolicus]